MCSLFVEAKTLAEKTGISSKVVEYSLFSLYILSDCVVHLGLVTLWLYLLKELPNYDTAQGYMVTVPLEKDLFA